MEFQKERVFTALNADELKPGSKVICANTLDSLKNKVNENDNITEVREILRESNERRFRTEFSGLWPLVYLISVPEEKDWIVYLCRRECIKPYLTCCRNDCWEEVQEEYGAKTKLFEGTEDEADKWYMDRRQFADVIAAWEDGKTIQFHEDSTDNWIDTIVEPKWSTDIQYRIKPEGLKWTNLKVGDVIWKESHTCPYMVIGMDYREESKSHILIDDTWLDDNDLNYWEKVE